MLNNLQSCCILLKTFYLFSCWPWGNYCHLLPIVSTLWCFLVIQLCFLECRIYSNVIICEKTLIVMLFSKMTNNVNSEVDVCSSKLHCMLLPTKQAVVIRIGITSHCEPRFAGAGGDRGRGCSPRSFCRHVMLKAHVSSRIT